MSKSAKFRRKVEAVQQLGWVPEETARSLAKNVKILKVKKRLALFTPGKQMFGMLQVDDEGHVSLCLTPNVINMTQNATGDILSFTLTGIPHDSRRKSKVEKRDSGAGSEVLKPGLTEGQGDSGGGVGQDSGDRPATGSTSQPS